MVVIPNCLLRGVLIPMMAHFGIKGFSEARRGSRRSLRVPTGLIFLRKRENKALTMAEASRAELKPTISFGYNFNTAD